jgi:hypothetical protein
MSPRTKTLRILNPFVAELPAHLMQGHLDCGGAGFVKACKDYEP